MPNPGQNQTQPALRSGLRNKSGQSNTGAKPVSNSGVTMASIDEYFIPVKPIDEELFKKVDTDRKLDMMAAAMNKLCDSFNNKMDGLREEVNKNIDEKLSQWQKKLDEKINPLWETVYEEEYGLKDMVNKLNETTLDETEGLKTKVMVLEKAATDMNQSYDELSKELDQMKFEQEILKGYISKHADHISSINDKIVESTAKSMEKNISITGLAEIQNEDPMELAKKFLIEELRISDIESTELYKIKEAFRIGVQLPDKPRTLIIKCNLFLKRKILEAYKEYKERLGKQTKPKFYVNAQLPDKMVEQNRLVRHIIWEQKKKDEGLPFDQKAKIAVQNNVVIINRKSIRKQLPKVRLHHMFQDDEIQRKLEDITLTESEHRREKGSNFQAFAATCEKPELAHLVQVRVRQLNPEASHVITVFNPAPDSTYSYALQDDGEHGGALRLYRYLKDHNICNVAVCVARTFGGVHIGPKRFQIMTELAKQAIDKL